MVEILSLFFSVLSQSLGDPVAPVPTVHIKWDPSRTLLFDYRLSDPNHMGSKHPVGLSFRETDIVVGSAHKSKVTKSQ